MMLLEAYLGENTGVNYQRSASESDRALNSSHNLWKNG
jgi:hypothetical protein